MWVSTLPQHSFPTVAPFLNKVTKIISMEQQDNKNAGGSTQTDNNTNQGSGGSDNRSNDKPVGDNTIKDPDNWTTGGEPMTGAQSSYLNTLASEAGESIDAELTKAEASKKIEELQQKTGRGLNDADNK